MLVSESSSSYEPYVLEIHNRAAEALPLSRSRDAMASNWMYWPFCMAGITLLMPMSAVLRTPQRTLFIILFLSYLGPLHMKCDPEDITWNHLLTKLFIQR